jgi:hypothetical protein
MDQDDRAALSDIEVREALPLDGDGMDGKALEGFKVRRHGRRGRASRHNENCREQGGDRSPGGVIRVG